MATEVIIHRTSSQLAWWLFGLGLAGAAWWGLPLIQSTELQNHFFGLFWYSMLALGTLFWAVPAEQRATATSLERRYCLLGIITLWRRVYPLGDFNAVQLDQEPSIFGRDSVWVLLVGPNDAVLVFARFRASIRGVARATALAQALVDLTGLPLTQPAAPADE